MSDCPRSARRVFKLDQLGSVARGRSRHRPRDDERLYGGPYPFFQTGDVKAANLTLKDYRQTYSDFGLAQSKLWEPGTLCITIAANIAESAILGIHGCFPDSVVGFIADSSRSDVRFVKYYIDIAKTQMQSLSRGTTQDNMSLEKLLAIDFLMPPIIEQRRIASILSAYDDLIENCQRRIRILEDMARGLYREWFVHFRFPGADSLPRVESPLGPIPQGWAVKLLNDCVEVNPRVTVLRDREKPFVPMGCLANDSMLITDVESRTGNSGAKFANGDTLFARITPCLENGKTGFVQFLDAEHPVAFGSTEFIVLRARTVTPEFVYLLARSDDFRANAIKSMSGASGRQRVQERCFDAYRLVEPTRQVLEQFSVVVRPMFQQIQRLHHKITNLRRTRDLLLPRLMSGQIDLRAAEPGAAAP